MNDIFVLPLTNSDALCLIDSEDSERVMQHSWHLDSRGYAYKSSKRKKSDVFLSYFVLNFSALLIDHKNRFKLDNRKINLRGVTDQQNSFNRNKFKNSVSRYKGVSYHNRAQKWRTRIGLNYKNISGGLFKTEVEAARKYNELALKYYGEYAALNEIPPC